MTLPLHPADTELPDSLLQASHKETGERQTERELFPKLLNSATKQKAIWVASSAARLRGLVQPPPPACLRPQRPSLSPVCFPERPLSRNFKQPAHAVQGNWLFQKRINSHRFQMYYSSKWMKMLTLLKNVFVYCIDLLHQVLVGARGIFAAFLWDLVSRCANSS